MRGCGGVEAFGSGVADASIPAPPTQLPAAVNPTAASQGQSGDLAALNEQFAAWVARQQARDGVVDLADGCRQYIKYREGIPNTIPNSAEAPRQASESQAPSFTLASKVAAGDSSFFAKSTALPFAPKIPSPLTEATPAASAAAEEAGDEEDIDPEVCVCARGVQTPAPVW
jgi:hypothetical protein